MRGSHSRRKWHRKHCESHPTLFRRTLGGIAKKPGVFEGRIEIREYLSVTISFDHDIIDGAPATRFTQRLKELVESDYGLCDQVISQWANRRITNVGPYGTITGLQATLLRCASQRA